MKKIFAILLIFVMSFILVGCGNKNVEPKTSSHYDSDNGLTTNSSEEIELYSDDTKVVFLFNKIRYVFYYSGDEITAYHTYVDYGDNATAKMAYSVIDREDETIKNCYVDGRYVVFEWGESEYEDLTYSNLRTAYSYMEELKK